MLFILLFCMQVNLSLSLRFPLKVISQISILQSYCYYGEYVAVSSFISILDIDVSSKSAFLSAIFFQLTHHFQL